MALPRAGACQSAPHHPAVSLHERPARVVGGSLFVPMENAWPAVTLRSWAALAATGAPGALTGALA